MGPVGARYPGRLVLSILVAASLLLTMAGSAAAKAAPPSLTASPNPLVFAAVTNVGAPCTDGGCTYAMLSITNGKGAPQTIANVAYSAPFFVTWGGTCDDVDHALTVKSHQTCTLEFGYRPTSSQASSAQGYVYFLSGAYVTFALSGPASQ